MREGKRQHLIMMRIRHEHFNCMQTVSCIIERERQRERGAMSICEMLKMVKWYEHFLCIAQYEIPYFNCMMRESARGRQRETETDGGREGECERVGGRERERHLTMMTMEPEHFNCMQISSWGTPHLKTSSN